MFPCACAMCAWCRVVPVAAWRLVRCPQDWAALLASGIAVQAHACVRVPLECQQPAAAAVGHGADCSTQRLLRCWPARAERMAGECSDHARLSSHARGGRCLDRTSCAMRPHGTWLRVHMTAHDCVSELLVFIMLGTFLAAEAALTPRTRTAIPLCAHASSATLCRLGA